MLNRVLGEFVNTWCSVLADKELIIVKDNNSYSIIADNHLFKSGFNTPEDAYSYLLSLA